MYNKKINMNNFDLKKYLIENKITTNSQMINEVDNTALMEIAKAVAKYYRDTDINIQDVTNDDLAEDLEKYIINDVDNKDNQALKTAYEQLMSQPFKEKKKNIDKIWNLVEKIQSKKSQTINEEVEGKDLYYTAGEMIGQVGLFTQEKADELEAEGTGNIYRFFDTPEERTELIKISEAYPAYLAKVKAMMDELMNDPMYQVAVGDANVKFKNKGPGEILQKAYERAQKFM